MLVLKLKHALLVAMPLWAISIVQLAIGDTQDAMQIAGLAVIIMLAISIRLPRRQVYWCLILPLSVFSIMAVASVVVSTHTFHRLSSQELKLLWPPNGLHAYYEGRSNFRPSAYRQWILKRHSEDLKLRISLRGLEAGRATNWLTSESTPIPVQPILVEDDYASLIEFGSVGSFAGRALFLSDIPEGDHVIMRLRASSTVPEQNCGWIHFGAIEDGLYDSSRFCFEQEPMTFEESWNMHGRPTYPRLGVVLDGFETDLIVEELSFHTESDTEHVSLGPPIPTGISLRLMWDQPYPWTVVSPRETGTTIELGTETKEITVALPDGLSAGTNVWAVLHAEPGQLFRVLNAEWSDNVLQPVPSINRLQFGFNHPNLLGHSAASAAMAAALAAPSTHLVVVGIASALPLIIASGSRTAILAMVAALAVFFVLGRRTSSPWISRGWILSMAIGAMCICIAIIAFTDWRPTLGGGHADVSSANQRVEIWHFSARHILERPLVGHSTLFHLAWESEYGDKNIVNHPHNALLDIGYRAGAPGILALLITFGLIVLTAPQENRFNALIGVFFLLSMNMTDSTYLLSTVMLPILVSINSR